MICASTGIAAIDYKEGVTAHTLFKIPVHEPNAPITREDDIVCGVGATTQRAILLRECSLIIWDEVAMMHSSAFHAVDALLRDIMANNIPFGGKIIVMGGDFRQTPPVV